MPDLGYGCMDTILFSNKRPEIIWFEMNFVNDYSSMSNCTVEDSDAKLHFFLEILKNFPIFFRTINKLGLKDHPYVIRWIR